ncbi:MAG: hypothetical protein Q9186_000703 [Xanthomendoza sp. 1 TL-2023]
MTDQVIPTSGIPRLSRLPVRSSIPQRPNGSTGAQALRVKDDSDSIRVQKSRPKAPPLHSTEHRGPTPKVFVKPLSTRAAAQKARPEAKAGYDEGIDPLDVQGPLRDQETTKVATRRPRPSLSDRAIQTLSHIPPSPSPRRRQSGFFPTDSPAIRPSSSLGRTRPVTSTAFYPPLPTSRPASPTKRLGPTSNARPTATNITSEQANRPAGKAKIKPSLQKPSLQKSSSAVEAPKPILKSSAALRETIANAKAARRAVPKYEGDEVAKPVIVNRSFDTLETKTVVDVHINPLRRRITSARNDGRLNISGMGLKVFPQEVLHMYDLDTTTEGPAWYESVDLTRLIAADNELEDLEWDDLSTSTLEGGETPCTSIFGYLQNLDLHGNHLQRLPLLLTHLNHLTVLNVSRNRLDNPIREIQAIIGRIDSLRELHLAENRFSGALPSLDNCRSLEILDIHSNAFTSLPAEWSTCTQLRRIDVSKNRITTLPRLDMPNLISINLSSNQIAIDDLMTNLKAPLLTSLDISNCRIDKLPPLRSLCPSLTTVLASDNRISILDVDSVRGLEVLDLKGNDLRSLPAELCLLGLKKLLVGGNPMRAPRREILEGTTERLMEWLKGRLPAGMAEDETF